MENTPPNLLFIVLDSVRADHTSLYGYDRQTTPFLESLAEDGYLIENTFAAAPWTPPSHASMFLGIYPSNHRYFEGGDSLTAPHPTLAEELQKNDYRTFGAVRNWHIDSQKDVTAGFEQFEDIYRLPELPESLSDLKHKYVDLLPGYLKTASKMMGTSRKPSDYVSSEYIKTRISSGGRPFFGFINIDAPHSPYAPPEPYRSEFESFAEGSVDMEIVKMLSCINGNGWQEYVTGNIDASEQAWNAVRDWYAGGIRFSDSLVEGIVNQLRTSGLYDNTMIVVTSDHGEHFGEHGKASHQFSLFDELLHVPLIIKPPASGENSYSNTDGLVSHVDLYPTILSEFDLSIPETVDGVDIFSARTRDQIFAEYNLPPMVKEGLEEAVPNIEKEARGELFQSLQCVRTNKRKFIMSDEGAGRLYEVSRVSPKDIQTTENDEAELKSSIERNLGIGFPAGGQKQLDEKSRENLEELGYI